MWKEFTSLSNRGMTADAQSSLLTAYIAAFKFIKDSDLLEASASYLKDGHYFPPMPSELIAMMPKGSTVVDESKFIIRPNTMCNRCHKFGLCIQEPAGHGPWICRVCYSGMTDAQMRAAFVNLGRAMTLGPGGKRQTARWNSKTREIELSGDPDTNTHQIDKTVGQPYPMEEVVN
jgi:hypothetical protein